MNLTHKPAGKHGYRSNLGFLLILLLMLCSVSANAVIVTKGFSGIWGQPDQESQGFDIAIIDQNGVRQATVYWYTYDTEGNPMWLTGLGEVIDNQISLDMLTVTGVTNLQPDGSEPINSEVLASVVIEFSSCQSGQANIKPKSIAGTGAKPNSISGTGGIVRIQRLTQIMSTTCSGGISDDKDPQEALEADEQFLQNTGVYPAANAKFKFEERNGSASFEVQVEDIPVGDYDLSVGEVIRGQIVVNSIASGTEGKLDFESPAENNELLLDFDPRGQSIAIMESGTVLFSSNFVPQPPPGNDPVGNGAPPFGESEIRIDMVNTGMFVDASGRVELKQRSDRVEFSVEIEDLSEGSYDLFIADQLKGSIVVISDEGGLEGEINFEFPLENNNNLLDFDPRGKHIEVRSGSQVALEVDF